VATAGQEEEGADSKDEEAHYGFSNRGGWASDPCTASSHNA
jgi:hypothetical protein